MNEPLMDEDLRVFVGRARRVAARAGSTHALWDAIFDAEAILSGKPAILPREQVEAILREVRE